MYDSQKKEEIEEILGIKLRNPEKDLIRIKEEWRGFYREPLKFKGRAVINLIKEWYDEI